MIVRYGGTYVHLHENKLLRSFESKADNIENDDSEDEDVRNTDATGNGTENNDDF